MVRSEDPGTIVERYEAAELNATEAVDAFRESVETADDGLELARDRLVDILDGEDFGARSTSASMLAILAERQPSVAVEAVPTLESLLEEDFPINEQALVALSHVAETEPDAAGDAVETAGSLLDSDNDTVRRRAAELFVTVSADDPSHVRSRVPDLVDLLLTSDPSGDGSGSNDLTGRAPLGIDPMDGRTALRTKDVAKQQEARSSANIAAATALRRVAESDPQSVVEHLSDLREGLSAGLVTRRSVLRVFVSLAEAAPETLESSVPAVSAVLRETDDPYTHGYALQALATLASTDVEVVPVVVDETETAVSALSADEPFVRGAAANLLSYLAEHRPEAVEPYEDELLAALDDKHVFIRGGIVWTLGSLSTDGARDRLRGVRDGDPDPRLRELADDLLTGE